MTSHWDARLVYDLAVPLIYLSIKSLVPISLIILWTRARNFKLLMGPEIDSKESTPPTHAARKAGTATLFVELAVHTTQTGGIEYPESTLEPTKVKKFGLRSPHLKQSIPVISQSMCILYGRFITLTFLYSPCLSFRSFFSFTLSFFPMFFSSFSFVSFSFSLSLYPSIFLSIFFF